MGRYPISVDEFQNAEATPNGRHCGGATLVHNQTSGDLGRFRHVASAGLGGPFGIVLADGRLDLTQPFNTGSVTTL